MKQALTIFTLIFMISFSADAKKVRIKFATLAPSGSTWANVISEMGSELKKKTKKKVNLKLYAGGVMGTEDDVIKKIKVGQLHAGGFTGPAAGKIVSDVRVLELPLLFKSYEEYDYVREKLEPQLESKFQAKGFKILGWGEVGFIRIFSNKPIKKQKDMEGAKMWMFEGDPLSSSVFQAFGVVPQALSVQDVLMALQTGMVDTFANSPYGAIALQWHGKVKYIGDLDISNVLAINLIKKKVYDKIKPEHQTIVNELATKYSKKLLGLTRKDNQKALKTILGRGVKLIKTEAGAEKVYLEKSQGVYEKLTGKLYDKALLDKVKSLIAEYRSGQKTN